MILLKERPNGPLPDLPQPPPIDDGAEDHLIARAPQPLHGEMPMPPPILPLDDDAEEED